MKMEWLQKILMLPVTLLFAPHPELEYASSFLAVSPLRVLILYNTEKDYEAL